MYSFELPIPNIRPFAAGNAGVPYLWRFEGQTQGPDVMICALTHGNEISGALVLQELLVHGVRPVSGSLTLCFNNVAAFEKLSLDDPFASRFIDEDFNRLWSHATLDSNRDSIELQRARQIKPFVDRADLLLDLHSMFEKSVPMMVCGPKPKGLELAKRIGAPQYLMVDQGHSLGTRLIDYANFGDQSATQNALLLESGQHWEKDALTCAKDVTARFLNHCSIGCNLPSNWIREKQSPLWEVRATEAIEPKTESFAFAAQFRGFERLHKGQLIATELIDGKLYEVKAPYDDCMLIMPTPSNVRKGVTVVRLGKAQQL